MVARMSYDIDAPVEKVFDFFKDPNSQVDDPRFTMEVSDVTMTAEGVGTYYRWSTKLAGIPLTGFSVYTEFVPNERIVERSSLASVGDWVYTFAPEGAGTRVTMEHHQRSLWALPLVSKVVDYGVTTLSRRFMAAVKAELEAGPTVPGQRRPTTVKSRKAAARR
jgi:uncharacterized protein YndB with AHSA1/START domain